MRPQSAHKGDHGSRELRAHNICGAGPGGSKHRQLSAGSVGRPSNRRWVLGTL